MKPLNNKERNKAFYKVVGLFLLSFVIALILGFVTMNVSKISDHNSKSELENLKNNLKFQEEVFAPNVGKTAGLLAKIPSYKEQGENIQVLNQDIGALLSGTKNQVVEDESWESRMYKDVIKALSDLQLAYNSKLELVGQLGDSDEIAKKLQGCIAEKTLLQNQITMLQAAGAGAGGGGGGGGADCAKCEKDLKDAQNKLRACTTENKALRSQIEKK